MKNIISKRKLLIIILLCVTTVLVFFYISYKKNNISSNVSSLRFSKHDLSKNKVFLLGTTEGVSANDELDFKLLKYLNKNAGVTEYLSEMQYSQAGMINEYLESGDEHILKDLYSIIENDQFYTDNSYKKWLNLYKYNETLPKNKKIKVNGLGLEKNSDISIKYFCSLLPDKQPPASISSTILTLKDFYNVIVDNESGKKYFLKLSQELKSNKSDYKNYLGKNYNNFSNEAKAIEFTCKNDINNDTYYSLSEKIMYENFNDIYSKSKDAKFYGYFDNNQVVQKINTSNPKIKKSFGVKLTQNNSPVKGKVLSIGCMYKNCMQLQYGNVIALSTATRNINPFDKSTTKGTVSSTYLYKLSVFNSSFIKKLYSVIKPTNGVGTDYYQYVIFVKNFKANTTNNLEKSIHAEAFNFAQQHHTNIDYKNSDNFDDFAILNDELLSHDVFFTGESHAVKFNYDLRFKFLKYLNQNADVKYYFAEIGYGSGVLLNKYLVTGDETLLKDIYKNLVLTPANTQDSYDFWVKLYNYNKSLPQDKKITVIGMDLEHQSNSEWQALMYLLPKENTPNDISPFINPIRTVNVVKNSEKNIKIFEKLQQNIISNEAKYIAYLGDNYFDFKMIVENMLNTFKSLEVNTLDYKIREEAIYSNFTKVYNHFPKHKYYGQWGSEHVYQHSRDSQIIKGDCFATKLNSADSPVKNRVLSIQYMYLNSMYRTTTGIQPLYSECVNKSIFDSISDSNATLFKLTGKDSPFQQKVYLVANNKGGVTTDYLQYLLMIKNSPAADELHH